MARWLRLFARRTERVPPASMQARALVAAGDARRNEGDWAGAADQYAAALLLKPDDRGLRVQYGHALKEAGRPAEAEAAYRAAAEGGDQPDAWLQLARMLRLRGDRDQALEAYAEALRLDPDFHDAREELVRLGGRGRLPEHLYDRSAAAARLARLATSLDETLKAAEAWARASIYPEDAWDAFRRAFPVQPPPPGARAAGPTVLIDARDAEPSQVRATLAALQDQRDGGWRAVVRGPAALLAHPVAALAKVDPRIAFEAAAGAAPDGPVLMLSAGVRLDPEAVGWFRLAAARTGAEAIYCDHDHHVQHWRAGRAHLSPALQVMPDRFDLAGNPQPPQVLWLAGVPARPPRGEAAEQRRALLARAVEAGRAAHLPRVLASVSLGDVAVDGPVAVRAAPAPARPGKPLDGRILVVIPTRDQPALLEACVASLRDMAEAPDAIEVVVLDNRSRRPATAAALQRLRESGVEVVAADEPFNWSRLNNSAAAGRDHPILVFANDDVRMLTRGWDARLRAHLADRRVGVLGARLLYPDMTVQHAGVVLGRDRDGPIHEGVGAEAADGGPLDRWRRTRQASAVTGAFLACRRETFETLGGFDAERLAIAFNDIDFCLRARSRGLAVLFAADVELVHHESKTRGHNDTPERVAWDREELYDLHRRWGEALFREPGVNPHWASASARPYDGFRDPPLSEILDHLDRSAADPWRVEAPQ